MTDYKAIKLIKNGCEYCFPSGGGGDGETYNVEYLLVAGGGGGGCAICGAGGGGGAGGLILRKNVPISSGKHRVTIGGKGVPLNVSSCIAYQNVNFRKCIKASQGGDSSFNGDIAKGGGPGMAGTFGAFPYGYAGGSGGGGGLYQNYVCISVGGGGILGQGTNGYRGMCPSSGNGGGAGAYNEATADATHCEMPRNDAAVLEISGSKKSYSRGGVGGVYSTAAIGADGSACGDGGGGGSRTCSGGCGAGGVFILRYPSAAGYNIEGGCKYECNGYCIHCFTDSGDLTVGDASGCYVSYLAVGGGGAGYCTGGGGGAVCVGDLSLKNKETCIVIGNGGSTYGANGGSSEICGYIVAPGGCGGSTSYGGTSGSGVSGGYSQQSTSQNNYGGGGGAAGVGQKTCCVGIWCASAGNGGIGYFGYGGGGGGGIKSGCFGFGFDGGGDTVRCNCAKACGNAKDYGGGGGGAFCGTTCFGNGCQGVVDICYACDGSWGIHSATGGNSCYVCNGMCVHRFTSNGTFTIVS